MFLSAFPFRFGLVALLALGLNACCAPLIVSGAATGAVVASDRRTPGTIMDDKGIELKAFRALNSHRALFKEAHITAISYNNVILLVGQAPTQALISEAESLLEKLPKVRAVYNEISLGKPNSLKQRAKDTWITTQMKASLLKSPVLHPTQIKVITEDGHLYLMGIVDAEEESEAIRLAQAIPGVQKVIKIFEEKDK